MQDCRGLCYAEKLELIRSDTVKIVSRESVTIDMGEESFHILTDGFAFVIMDIMSAIEINRFGMHLQGKLLAIGSPV